MTSISPISLPGSSLSYYDVQSAVEAVVPGAFAKMPYASRVFAENLLRKSTAQVLKDGLPAILIALVTRSHDKDFPFYPARVVLQDLLGTPALVDLAGMRDAVAEAGGDPRRVNPIVPTQLVVDHSLNVEVAGSEADAMSRNMETEQRKNAERFEFLAWCKKAFTNLDVLMPGSGILHQINIERMSPVIQVNEGIAYPDTLVGTDSHTTMIDALGVVGWGVGGLEAESVMLGRAIWMRLPQLVRVQLDGSVRPGVLATDVVLALAEFLRGQNVVGAILEFHGPGAAALPLADRATISNMAPEFGATAAMFAIDERTLDYMLLTGRTRAQVDLTRAYAKAQGLWADQFAQAQFDRTLAFDLGIVVRSLAGPSDPHQRISLASLKTKGIALESPDVPTTGPIPDGAVLIAAITSCTNTSNPRSMIAAGLLARKAIERGLTRKPWVKTSLAPGSKAVELYLASAGLLEPLKQLGFGIIGFGCTSCNGMSGPLAPAIESEVLSRKVHTTAVLSGNRNFDGRVHPHVKEAFLASPALVVAYAIAGSIRVDVESGVLATDSEGTNVLLSQLWPSDAEIDEALQASVKPEQFTSVYDPMFRRGAADAPGTEGDVPVRFAWREDSTYIRRPPYWEDEFTSVGNFAGLRPLAVLSDNVTTDHLSPSGAILPDSAAGEFLQSRGVAPVDFNSYGTRRGNHVAAIRATFANNRLKNEMAGREGSLTCLQPEGVVMRLFDAAETYMQRGQPLIIVAGKNYGSGSSRDWAAKGVRLIGVKVVVCENFERIHRTNLVGMGVLPLEFPAGVTRKSLDIDGTETFDVEGVEGVSPGPDSQLTLVIHRTSGSVARVPVVCRIDTEEERQIFAAGGLLQRIEMEFMKAAV
ncbi:aconitate hydratase AcnA [Polaromonas jejuensis]|uniref:Aconitate hydratase n=1 Tax=Polaromonas jejuensis TaxID=457502 RepID=A0ABW0QFX7_9BURK|nr:aconitate hydratase AcnA [Polaromonas jejuensis]